MRPKPVVIPPTSPDIPSKPPPKARHHFGKAAEAREAFAKNARAYVTTHKKATQKALKAGDTETAMKGAQWALQHMPADSEGRTILAPDTDAKTLGSGADPHGGVQILIGGFTPPESPKRLASVVDVTPKPGK